MGSRYDDELWELVPEEVEPSPSHLRRFVRGLGPVERALDLGCGDGRLSAELMAGQLTIADVSRAARSRLPHATVVELDPDTPYPCRTRATTSSSAPRPSSTHATSSSCSPRPAGYCGRADASPSPRRRTGA